MRGSSLKAYLEVSGSFLPKYKNLIILIIIGDVFKGNLKEEESQGGSNLIKKSRKQK